MCVQPVLIIVNMLYEQITRSENIPPQGKDQIGNEDQKEILRSSDSFWRKKSKGFGSCDFSP